VDATTERLISAQGLRPGHTNNVARTLWLDLDRHRRPFFASARNSGRYAIIATSAPKNHLPPIGAWTIGDLFDAALVTQPIMPVRTAPDRRKRFRVVAGGKT
jgi:hypothetical protein